MYTSCPPCIELLPYLQKLHDNYGKRGLTVIGMSTVSTIDSKPTLESFIAKHNIAILCL
ncbi:MAG: redoxin family protein [Prevotellaceae bacterium]|nr:redoxin family protein [Prevotellaceae bacterium]